jgi:hypothetical protein
MDMFNSKRCSGHLRRIGAVAVTLGFVLCSRIGSAQGHPHIRRWTYEATILSFEDPYEFFPDIRLGDTLVGAITVDTSTLGRDVTGTHGGPNERQFYYENALTFPTVSASLINPRTSEEIRFLDD